VTDPRRAAAIELLNHLAYDHANHPENLEESIEAIYWHDKAAEERGRDAERERVLREAREATDHVHWLAMLVDVELC
jgi:hypothetical protein